LGILRIIFIRVVYAIALLLAVIVLNFSLMHMAPGDVADTISQSMGGADQEILDEIRVSYGLDQPFIVQLGRYISNEVHDTTGQRSSVRIAPDEICSEISVSILPPQYSQYIL
jgi:peptide/nickel transport system permease protein